jgi:hypothetical protein
VTSNNIAKAINLDPIRIIVSYGVLSRLSTTLSSLNIIWPGTLYVGQHGRYFIVRQYISVCWHSAGAHARGEPRSTLADGLNKRRITMVPGMTCFIVGRCP